MNEARCFIRNETIAQKGNAMFSKNRLFGCAAVLLVLLILFPAVYNADAGEEQKAKIAPELAVQLSAAKPGEHVTAVVRMRARPQLLMLRGDQMAVVNELRRVTKESQAGLVRYLNKVDIQSKVKTIRQFWIDNLVLVKAAPDVIAEIAARPDVQEVFENFTITIPEKPERSDRPNLGQSQTQLWDSITKIGAKQVWSSYGLNGTGVVVGGLDTGVDVSHPDISGKMKTTNPGDPTYPGGWAEFDANGNIIVGSVPHDTDGHGTHTTGTMIGGNASGYDIGVAPGATLMHGLVIPGGSGYFAQVIGGMEWIIDPDGNPVTDDGCRVVNMSLGASGTHTQMITPVDNMIAANVFPAISIGNDGPSPGTTGSPGNVPSAFGVGATDSSDVIADFSSRGPVTWNTPPYVGTYIKPDISAPGVKIYSSVPGGDWQWHGAGWDWSGTSMSAPHVAGTAVLMFQVDPTLDVEVAKDLIAQSAVELGAPGKDNDYGWGRINAFGAVTAALAGVGTLQGTIYSSGGGTVENAKILITDTGQYVFSDEFGDYTIQTVAGDHPVEVSRFGYETYSTVVTIVADAVTPLNVTLNQLPSGTVAGFVTDNETAAGIEADVTVELGGEAVVWTATDPSTGEYSVTLPIGSYDLVFSPVFPYPMTTRTNIEVFEGVTTPLDVGLDAAQVLVVDDDKGQAFELYYEAAINAAGRSYLTVTTPPTAAEMVLFESVVWLTGNDWSTTIEAADEAELAAYLDGGGRLFISGQDIGYDIRTSSFYADYLHAVYVQDDVGLGAVIGEVANPVGSGLAFAIQGGTGANNQGYPSEIDILTPAQTAFVYDETVPMGAVTANDMEKGIVEANGITSSGTAGLTVDTGTYKLVYFAFGFEAIAEEADRTIVMGRVLDWLLGYPEITHTPISDTENDTDPYQVTALITAGHFALDPTTFAVVYDVGAGDVSVPMTATGVPDEYEAYIPAQPIGTEVYYYIMAGDVEGHTSYDPVGAPLMRHMFNVGWDEEAPTVVHGRYYNTNDLDGPYTICADVTDNLGVESVYLMYAKNGGMFHRMEMILGVEGLYCASIPGPSEVGDYYEYCIYAMDESYHGNVTRVPEEGYYRFEIVEYFSWDFELDDGGFTPAGGVWEWGEPTSGPGGAHSGVNLWATILAGSYPNSADATLDIPPITLAGSKPYALLSMWHWYYIETNYDGGNVKVSSDGGMTWTVVEPIGGYDGTARSGNAGIPGEECFTGYNNDFWQMELFDLSDYAGQQVQIRFHFGSDGSVYRSGWYVDDVVLRSTDIDDFPPVISGTEVPASTFDTAGPYEVTTYVTDPLSDVATVSIFYSTDDGASFTEVAMSAGAGDDEYNGDIPGQPSGTNIKFYIKATDTSSEANEAYDPAGAPTETHEFSILPSAPILVLQMTSSATSLEMFRQALEANGHEADYWYMPTQGWLAADKLSLYKTIILDETGSLTTTEQADLGTYLESGMLGARKQFFIMGRDLGFYSSTRPWIEEYMRAAYVQDNPGWRELTGEPGEPIGAGEVFVISGSYPDEIQRSDVYPGGEIVYRYTGLGTASETRSELEGAYEKDGKEWDGVMPHAPKSLDAAAGIKYAGDGYRSVYFAFNFYYIQEPERRAGIMHRALGWLSAPEIVHEPLHDTEDTLNAYTAVAELYSDDLDPSRVFLIYDMGAGPVTLTMAPTGNPDEYAADIPAQSFGTTVSYYLSASNFDGNTSYHPGGAPAVQHTFEVTADITPPEIVHVPHPNTTDQTGPYIVEATITDNVGVDPAGVFLTYNKNGGTDATVNMTNVGGDLYQGAIPGPAVLYDVFNYYIRARDIADVPNYAREPATGYHSFEIVDYFAWDFEANDGGFAATGPDWEWGEPTTGPDDAHSGVNVWATKIGDNYSSSSDSRLETPEITVPAVATYAVLSFWQWYYIETNWDGGNVKISTDGGSSWTILTPDIGYNGTAKSGNAGIPLEPCFTGYNDDYWHLVTFDLTPYMGTNVIIRWHFGSDSYVQKVGWYIDDVRMEGIEDTESPVFVSTDVPAGTFDTVGPYTVTTTVTDALSGVATVDLYYSTDDGGSWTSVAMAPTGNPDEYSGDIPGQSAGTRIKLYLEAEDNAANTSTDPAGAPAITYEFGIMPSGDYLVLLGGGSHTTAEDFQFAFSAMGRTADIWDWDDLGVPTVAILQVYDAVIIDESWYFDGTQMDTLGAFLSTSLPSYNQIIMMGRDLSYSSSTQAWMEQYTGSAYVQDDPSWRQLTSTPGDPIGNDETFVIQGYFPDELRLSTTYTGGYVIYTYSGLGSSLDLFDTENELREFYEKEGKEWDPKVWPMAPAGPDSAAAVRYVGTTHASAYFAFNLNYVQEETRRAEILDRALDWLASASGVIGKDVAGGSLESTPEIPENLMLWQNYPNPFNPVTRVQFGIPKNVTGPVQLRIYNVKGELVKTLFEGTKEPGIHTFTWDGTNDIGHSVSSGLYFCRFVAGDVRMVRKMVLLR
ncbi:MAG: S8 family serine peptidase [bacterium]|nr:MAG: S8 family serine peptidase [bacterium]